MVKCPPPIASLVGAVAIAGIALVSTGASAADLTVYQEGPVLSCQTVFTGLPVPPYFIRRGCIHNVITVHRLPEHRRDHVVLKERDVVIDPEAPVVYVTK